VASIVREMGYDNIGTVEMLYGPDGSFSFLEMNTRLQVEHGVTEEVTGTDLVKAQVRCAAGERLAEILPSAIELKGHAIQARVYAEDPKNFFPSPGKLKVFRPPRDPAVRVETGYAEGRDVTPHYDPMIAKVIVHASTRAQAIERLIEALEAFEIQGPKNNIPAVLAVLRSDAFRSGEVHTGILPQVLAKKS
jgi:acetyl-CoA carboxylase, biotin carboxylase subunit